MWNSFFLPLHVQNKLKHKKSLVQRVFLMIWGLWEKVSSKHHPAQLSAPQEKTWIDSPFGHPSMRAYPPALQCMSYPISCRNSSHFLHQKCSYSHTFRNHTSYHRTPSIFRGIWWQILRGHIFISLYLAFIPNLQEKSLVSGRAGEFSLFVSLSVL